MKRSVVTLMVALTILVPVLLALPPSPATGQDGSQATINALQTENATLRTQVATLQTGHETPTSPAVATASPDEMSTDERGYLAQVTIALDQVDAIRERWDAVLDGAIQIQLTSWKSDALNNVLAWVILPALLPPDAPTPRLTSFHVAFQSGLTRLANAGSAYSDAIDAEDVNDFNQVTDDYHVAIRTIDGAMKVLDQMGLTDDLELIRNPPAAPGTHNITGSITLYDPDGNWITDFCSGDGGYSDLVAGAQVLIRNESGTILATGELGFGEKISTSACTFPFEILNVPDAAFYSIELGRRGGPTYSFADLEANGWTIELSIGG